MKRLAWSVMLLGSFLIAGCAYFPSASQKQVSGEVQPVARQDADRRDEELPNGAVKVHDEAGAVIVQKVAFRTGVSSTTVERMARRFGCVGKSGAGLITEKGPVEVYRLQCDNGTSFLAQCEFRQCRPMR